MKGLCVLAVFLGALIFFIGMVLLTIDLKDLSILFLVVGGALSFGATLVGKKLEKREIKSKN